MKPPFASVDKSFHHESAAVTHTLHLRQQEHVMYDYDSYMSLNEDIPVAVSLSDVGSALVIMKASSLSSVLTGMKVYYQ